MKYDEFIYCGKTITQTSAHAIHVSMKSASMNIDTIPVRRGRAKQPDRTLTAAELSDLRACIGQLGWAARQGRPDLLFQASTLGQAIGHPTVQTLLDANKAARDAADGADFSLAFLPSEHVTDLAELQVFSNADASFANVASEYGAPSVEEYGMSPCCYDA